MDDIPVSEQLRLVPPEYDHALHELDSLVASFLDRFPDDIEYYRNGCGLSLRSEGMAPNTYYVVSKSLPFPYPEAPDWSTIKATLGHTTEHGKNSGYTVHYEMDGGLLTATSAAYDNNEFLDEDWPSPQELSEADIRRIIDELSAAEPVHPDAIEQGKIGKIARVSSFIKRVLFRK